MADEIVSDSVSEVDDKWAVVEGRVHRASMSGRHDGLVRALCWGKNDAWGALTAFVSIVRDHAARITELERRLNDAGPG